MEELIIAIQELGQQTWMDYANVGATIVGILVSTIAVIVAVSVPKRIAREQNKIALFKQRYDLYVSFTKATAYIKILEISNITSKKEAVLKFLDFIGGHKMDGAHEESVRTEANTVLMQLVSDLGQIKYLFKLKSDDDLGVYAEDLVNLIKANDDQEYMKCLEKIKKSATTLRANMESILEKHLYIK